MKKHPKLLRSLLNLTSEDSKIPTNIELDEDIEKLGFLMHYVWPLLTKIARIKLGLFLKYKWKVWVKALAYVAILATAIIYALFKVAEPIFITQSKKEIVTIYKTDSTMTLQNFLTQIAFMEAGNNPEARRPGSQFWGLYQIGDKERVKTGYGDITWDVYKKHPEIQRMCMLKLLKLNREDLKYEIDTYSGKIVDGMLMTESGILALAQLGTGFAKGCLKSGIIPIADGNGNKPREYVKLGGYNLDSIH